MTVTSVMMNDGDDDDGGAILMRLIMICNDYFVLLMSEIHFALMRL